MNNKNLGMVENLTTERVYDGFFKMDKLSFDQKRFDGGTMEGVVREVLIRKPVVFLSLFDPKAEVHLLVSQVRVGAIADKDRGFNQCVCEPIAGIIDDGESAMEAAVREAMEEAKVEVGSIQLVHSGYQSSGGSSEFAYFFTGLFDSSSYNERSGGLESEQEDIRSHLIPHNTAMYMVGEGTINSLSGAFGIYWHEIHSM